MKKSLNIQNELQSISPEVARLSGELPYEAPAGYFEGLADRMLAMVKALDMPLPAVLQAAGSNPFTVPAGYFEGLAAQVLQRVKSEEALADLPASTDNDTSALLQKAGANPYTVPAGYFESLPESLLRLVKANEATDAQEELSALSPLLSGLNKKMPFSTPEGYFTDLTDNAVSGARAIDFVNEELENLSPLMSSLRDKTVYEVPVGYFDTLPAVMLEKVGVARPAKVLSMRTTARVLRYAAAAVVIGVMAMATWWYAGKSGNTVNPGEQLAVKELNKNLDAVSDTELQSYLEEETAPMAAEVLATNVKAEDIKGSDVKDMLVDVSDDEIMKYLEQNTSITKNISTN